VQQHILGVVDNVIYRFAGNLTGFPAVKENWLRYDEIIITRAFWDTVYIVHGPQKPCDVAINDTSVIKTRSYTFVIYAMALSSTPKGNAK